MSPKHPMSLADRERALNRPGVASSTHERPASFFIRAFWLVANPWFGFGIAAILAAIALHNYNNDRGSDGSRDRSRVATPGFAAVIFTTIGVASLVVRRELAERGVEV